MEVSINTEKFFERIEKLQSQWLNNKNSTWGGVDALCIPLGAAGEDLNYSKSSSFHVYMFGYEFPDSVIVLTKNNFYFMATAKKCSYLEAALEGKSTTCNVHILKRGKDEGQNVEHFNTLVDAIRKAGKKLGNILKTEFQGNFIPSWQEHLKRNLIEEVDISANLGLFFATKDEFELV